MREHVLPTDASAYARAMREHRAPAHATDGRTDGRTHAEPLNLRGKPRFRTAHEPTKAIILPDGSELPEGDHFDVRCDVTPRAELRRQGERAPIASLVRQLVYRRDGWSCQICFAHYEAASALRESGPLCLDHIRPWSNWAEHEAVLADRSDNLRTLCWPCNEKRSNRYAPTRDLPSVPIVARCAWCFCGDDAHRPEHAFQVFCGAHNGAGWALPGWVIL